jgi:dihydrofolate reductase
MEFQKESVGVVNIITCIYQEILHAHVHNHILTVHGIEIYSKCVQEYLYQEIYITLQNNLKGNTQQTNQLSMVYAYNEKTSRNPLELVLLFC